MLEGSGGVARRLRDPLGVQEQTARLHLKLSHRVKAEQAYRCVCLQARGRVRCLICLRWLCLQILSQALRLRRRRAALLAGG